jgi:16S rRNA processing protein RimM
VPPLARQAKKRGSPLESSSSTEQPRFQVARLGRPHGLKGFLGLYVDDEDLVHFEPGSTVYLDDEPYRVRAIRKADRGYHVAFDEVPDRTSAESIRNRDITVPARRELAEDEYWPEDLIGLEVRPDGGAIADVVFGPAQARLVIERDESRFEIPFVEELVPVVDLEGGYVEVVEIEGLTQPEDR